MALQAAQGPGQARTGAAEEGGCPLLPHATPSPLLCGRQLSKDPSNSMVCRFEELRLRPQGLCKFLDKVRACAADEGAHLLLQRRATEFSALLRFREKVRTAPCHS